MTVVLFTKMVSVKDAVSHTRSQLGVQGATQPLTLIYWLITHFHIGCHWSYASIWHISRIVKCCDSSNISFLPQLEAMFPYPEVWPCNWGFWESIGAKSYWEIRQPAEQVIDLFIAWTIWPKEISEGRWDLAVKPASRKTSRIWWVKDDPSRWINKVPDRFGLADADLVHWALESSS